MIVGLGLDLVEIVRIERAAGRPVKGHAKGHAKGRRGRFVEKYFTEAETAYAASMHRPMEHLAARFAAKEATAKAFGTGFSGGVRLREIEVVTEDSGRPKLVLHGAAAERAKAMGVTRTHVSLTHTDTHAAAVVVLEGEAPEGG